MLFRWSLIPCSYFSTSSCMYFNELLYIQSLMVCEHIARQNTSSQHHDSFCSMEQVYGFYIAYIGIFLRSEIASQIRNGSINLQLLSSISSIVILSNFYQCLFFFTICKRKHCKYMVIKWSRTFRGGGGGPQSITSLWFFFHTTYSKIILLTILYYTISNKCFWYCLFL